MTNSVKTLIAAVLFGAVLLAGSVSPVFAGDGCGKDKGDRSTSTLTPPVVLSDQRIG